MSKETIFKVGDEVYHFLHGKGKITEVCNEYNLIKINLIKKYSLIRVDFSDDTSVIFPYDTAKGLLSFTPYNLVNGGFSQERPNPKVEDGQLVYVCTNHAGWIMRYATGEFRGNMIEVYASQNKEGSTTAYKTYSLTNPLEQ